MGKINCCHKCEKRHIGCHGTCKDYINERKELDKANKEIWQKKQKQKDVDSYVYKGRAIALKRKEQHL